MWSHRAARHAQRRKLRLGSISHDLLGTDWDLILGYAYNPAGQMTQRTSSNGAYRSTTAYAVNRSYAANGLNQYTAAGPATFTYDGNGNLTSDGSVDEGGHLRLSSFNLDMAWDAGSQSE